MIAIVSDERVIRFVEVTCGRPIVPPYSCVGVERDGEIVTGVVFNHYTGCDVHVTVAGSAWPRGGMADLGDYVFSRLKCERMTIVTEQPKVVRLVERLGGQLEGLMRNHFGPGRDGFLAGILKSEWPF